MNLTIYIDDKRLSANSLETILEVALRNDIFIPHLCNHFNYKPSSCRLCFVEVAGEENPVTACSTLVKPNMLVKTKSPQIDKLIKIGFELILSSHKLECKICPLKGKCNLLKIAKEKNLPLKSKFPPLEREDKFNNFEIGISYYPNQCILCSKCVQICKEEGQGILGFYSRGFERQIIAYPDLPSLKNKCDSCQKCIKICPVGALRII